MDDGAQGSQRHDVRFANREYAVLKREFPISARAVTDIWQHTSFISDVPISIGRFWLKGMRVPGTRVSSAGCFGKKLRVELKGEGLTLIEGTVESLAARRR